MSSESSLGTALYIRTSIFDEHFYQERDMGLGMQVKWPKLDIC